MGAGGRGGEEEEEEARALERAREAAVAASLAGLWGLPGESLALSRAAVEGAGEGAGAGASGRAAWELGVPTCRLGMSGLAYTRARSSARHRLPPVLPEDSWPRLTPWSKGASAADAAPASPPVPAANLFPAARTRSARRDAGCQPVADAGTQTVGHVSGVRAELDGVAEGLDPGGPIQTGDSQPRRSKAPPPSRTSASGPAADAAPRGARRPEWFTKRPESFELPWFSSGRSKPPTRGRAAASAPGEVPPQKVRSGSAGGPSGATGVPAGVAAQRTRAGLERQATRTEGHAAPGPSLGGTNSAPKKPSCHCFAAESAELAVGLEAPRAAAPDPGDFSTEHQPCPRKDGPVAEKKSAKLRRRESVGGLKVRLDELENLVEAQFCQLQSAGYIRVENGGRKPDEDRGGPPSLRELERAIEQQHDDLVAQGVL